MTRTKKGKGCNQILPPEISETTFQHPGASADTYELSFISKCHDIFATSWTGMYIVNDKSTAMQNLKKKNFLSPVTDTVTDMCCCIHKYRTANLS